MIKKIKEIYAAHRPIIIYGIVAVIITLLDMIVSYSTERLFLYTGIFRNFSLFGLKFKEPNVCLMVANTLGVVTGFTTQFILSSKRVFGSNSRRTFVIYLITFGLGLILQDGIVALSRNILFGGSDQFIPFFIGKCLSIVLPFFFTFYVRRKFIKPDLPK